MNKSAREKKRPSGLRSGQASFTMLETIIAVGLMVTVILEVSNVQGSAISFTKFDRKVTQATWLAKAVMAKIEWGHRRYDLKELAGSGKATEQEFDERLCPRDPAFDCDFKYNVTIEEWALPFVDIISNMVGGGGGSSNDDEGSGSSKENAKNPFGDMIKQYVDSIFGEDMLKIARVEVFWPEGSKRGNVELTYLLPNQRALNRFILEQKGFKRQGAVDPKDAPKDGRGPPPGTTPGAPLPDGANPGGGSPMPGGPPPGVPGMPRTDPGARTGDN